MKIVFLFYLRNWIIYIIHNILFHLQNWTIYIIHKIEKNVHLLFTFSSTLFNKWIKGAHNVFAITDDLKFIMLCF